MPEVSLRAQTGRSTGSRDSRRVRKTGDVPAIVYGKGTDPVSIAVNAHDLHVVLHTEAGANALINLEIEGGATLLTMARVIERHPFRNEYRHIDFVTVSLDEIVTAEVAIHFEGSPIGVKDGGVFSPQRTHVVIEALPNAIPSAIILDVSDVEIGDSLRIADLPVIDGVTYTEDPDAVVMSVTTMAAEEVEEPEGELEGEGEESAEGEQAAEDDQEGESGE
jgi:large subunit ribosomal protein L25